MPLPPRFRCRAKLPAALSIRHHSLLLLVLLPPFAAAQQQYEANAQTDCYANNGSSVLGYTCSNPATSPPCAAYLSFRSAPPRYYSPITVSYLLNATATAVAAANAIPVSSPVPDDSLILVPVRCACTAAGYYQHDAAYVIQFDDETYFTIANDTYQGLATCQALMAQNPSHDSLNLSVGISLTVPLRCACPSAAQGAAGVKYLVTYLLGWDDDSSTVADRFRADYQAVLHANSLTDDSTVYPFTTMLVPLKAPPTPRMRILPEPPTPSPATGPAPAPEERAPQASSMSGSGRWRVIVGVGVGCGVLVSGAVLALLLLWLWRRRPRKALPNVSKLVEYGAAGREEGAKATPSSMSPMLANKLVVSS